MPNSIPAAILDEKLWFTVAVHEGVNRFFRAAFTTKHDAVSHARRQWDDALPNNSVWVYERKGTNFIPIGRVSSTGDGGCVYEDVPNA